MSSIRVWELGRLAGLETHDVLRRLESVGSVATTHASTVPPEDLERFWAVLARDRESRGTPYHRPKSGRDLALLRRGAREAAPSASGVLALVFLELLSTPLLLLYPIPIKIAVDSVLGDDALPGFLGPFVPSFFVQSPYRLLVFAALLQVLVVALAQLRGLAAYVLQTRVGEGITLAFRSKLFRHSQHLSLGYHDRRGPVDAIYRIEYDAQSLQYTVDSSIPLVSSAVMLVATIVVTSRIDLQLAIVAIAITPILFTLSRGYISRVRGRYHELKRLETSALRVVQEVLSAVRVVKAFGREDAEQHRFVRLSGDTAKARTRLALAEGAFGAAIAVTTAVGTALVLFVGVRGVLEGRLTLGALLLVLGYLAQLYGPLQQMAQKIGDLQSSLVGAERAFELLDEHPEVVESPGAGRLRRAKGSLGFERVWFTYDGRTPVLRNVSFDIEAGDSVGIVGPTGAGKTTLVSLVTRFYDPSSGEVLIDGADARDFKLSDLRDQFALVLQEPVLFSTTIEQNLRYADPNASWDEIVAAAKAAGAHDFVSTLPDGYDSLVGERGMRLSGGERQRISLARAFLRDAPILILDEPTSAVDLDTEGEILEAMRRLMEDRTTLLVTHRLSALAYCDVFLEVRGGRARLLERLPDEADLDLEPEGAGR